jgi:hypothetical protein
MQEFTSAFGNLLVAITADAFVGSQSSNWCRLIDEMHPWRSTYMVA